MVRTKARRDILRCMSSCCCLLLCLAGWCSPSLGDWRDDVGYTKLIDALGAAAPTGAGVPISLVEAMDEAAAYFPDGNDSQFAASGDLLGIAVAFIDGSGEQTNGVSGHANAQAERFFGNTLSVAPAANTVTVYEANDYLTNVLNVSKSNSPDTQDFRVQNFSWVGTFATSGEPTLTELNKDRDALRRFDYAIDVDNITAFVGLQNATSPLPRLLSHSYNAIAVGRSIGGHGVGLTHLDNYGIGRSKPDLVAPQTTSSAATAITSSVATFLHSADTVLGSDAAKSVTMKAILLAGASKEPFPAWSQIDANGEWHPLDDTYGAGEVNVYNSYLATLGGQFVGSTTTPTPVASHGWDYRTIQPGSGNELLYDFVIPSGSFAAELSIALAWNAVIEKPFSTGDPIVADLNLELVDANGMTIDFDINDNLVEGLSQSNVDNVEHLYLTDLTAGTYTLKVSSEDLASDFGIAWRTSTWFETFSSDFDDDGDTDGADFLTWQRGFGTLINATHASGDADGDGDVDRDDLGYSAAGTIALLRSISAVPEPASWVFLAVGLLLAIGFRSYRSLASLKR